VHDARVRLFLARHGHAVPEDRFLPDDYRHLSAQGRGQATGVGQVLAREGVAFDAILSSPLTRAIQTAELMGAAAGFAGTIEVDVGLCPGSSPHHVVETLSRHTGTVLVVGHMPGVTVLGGLITGKPGFPPLKPGHVFAFDGPHPLFKVDPDRFEVETLLVA